MTWQQAACTVWFHGEHLGKAMATALSVQHVVGSALSFVVLPAIPELMHAVWAAVALGPGCLAWLGLFVPVEGSPAILGCACGRRQSRPCHL